MHTTVLLVEDDDGDAFLVQELIYDAAADIALVRAKTIGDARDRITAEPPDCVILDLHLPDGGGLPVLSQIQQCAPSVPVIVLTGLSDEHFGVAAVSRGAQDYLVKGRVDADVLGRAIRYAIERKRAELTTAELRASELRAQENARLERGLLPSPLLLTDSEGINVVTRYRPRRNGGGALGGDFFDAVQTSDGAVHVVIGDVSGHGPDEAAVGVALRIAWRTLVLAGIEGTEQMRYLEEMLCAERFVPNMFATATTAVSRPDETTIDIVRAGHPAPLIHHSGFVQWADVPSGPALGIYRGGGQWTKHKLEAPPGSGLVLLTDGMFESPVRPGERLGEAGLLGFANELAERPGEAFVDALIAAVERAAKPYGGLDDDVAVVRLQTSMDTGWRR